MNLQSMRADHPEIEDMVRGLPNSVIDRIIMRAGLMSLSRADFLDLVLLDADFAKHVFQTGLLAARAVFYRFEEKEAPFDPDLMCVEGANMAEGRIMQLIENAKRR